MLWVPPHETHVLENPSATEDAEYVVARDSPTEDAVEVPVGAAMRLRVLEGDYAVCRLGAMADDAGRRRRAATGFWSLTEVGEERSLVCLEDLAPATGDGATVVRGWRILEVLGPLDLGADRRAGRRSPRRWPRPGVPIFPIATHDTDWILVPGRAAGRGAGGAARRGARHRLRSS